MLIVIMYRLARYGAKGMGVRAGERIRAGALVIEYVGRWWEEVITLVFIHEGEEHCFRVSMLGIPGIQDAN